jgi:hypothetical protein
MAELSDHVKQKQAPLTRNPACDAATIQDHCAEVDEDWKKVGNKHVDS